MARLALLTLLVLPAATYSLTYATVSTLENTEQAAELSARRSLAGAASLLDGLQADVMRLTQVLRSPHTASLVQISSEAAPAASKPVLKKKKGIDAATAVKEMNKLTATKGSMAAQGPAMLGLLTGMYDSWKEKIGDANKKERAQKKVFDATISDLEKKKAMYKGSKDAQDTYDRIEKYWKRQRSISHRQYHTALKIMHGGMQKFKAVSGAMSNAIAGKKPSPKDLQTVGLAMPDIMFVQLNVFTQEAQADLRSARVLSNA